MRLGQRKCPSVTQSQVSGQDKTEGGQRPSVARAQGGQSHPARSETKGPRRTPKVRGCLPDTPRGESGARGGEETHHSKTEQSRWSFFLVGPCPWRFFGCSVTWSARRCLGRLTVSVLETGTLSTNTVKTALYVLVAAATSASCRGTSQQNITFQMFLRLQKLCRNVSRPVAALVYPSLKDVAASQCVCSRGADNLSSFVSSFGSDLSSSCFGWCYGRCRLH